MLVRIHHLLIDHFCRDKNDKCCKDCAIKAAGEVCRASRGVCDMEEKCDGVDGTCPNDKFLDDLAKCEIAPNMPGQCALGDCTSRDYQCQIRGTLADITRECPGFSNQCSMFCQASASSSACLQINGFYVDGTACGYNGKCFRGECQSDFCTPPLYRCLFVVGTIIGWFQAHLVFSIALVIAVGFMMLFVVSRCCVRCMNSRKAPRPGPSAVALRPMSQNRSEVFNPNGAPPPRPSRTVQRGQWVDPALYNGVDGEVDLSSVGVNERSRTESPSRRSRRAVDKPLPRTSARQ